MADGSESPCTQECANLGDCRQEAGPQRFHREGAADGGCVFKGARVGDRCRQRLLDQHRLAGREEEGGMVAMERIGRGDVDRVDVGGGGERADIVRAADSAEACGESRGVRSAAG
ncbi:hypothetical protein D9M72_520280 [compost metagenome]